MSGCCLLKERSAWEIVDKFFTTVVHLYAPRLAGHPLVEHDRGGRGCKKVVAVGRREQLVKLSRWCLMTIEQKRGVGLICQKIDTIRNGGIIGLVGATASPSLADET